MSRSCRKVKLRHVLWHLSRDATVSSIQGKVLYFSGIRAGIGSLRICKLSVILYKHRNKMHREMKESAESKYLKGTIYICISCI